MFALGLHLTSILGVGHGLLPPLRANRQALKQKVSLLEAVNFTLQAGSAKSQSTKPQIMKTA